MSRPIKFRCWDVKARFMKDDGTLPQGQPHMKYDIGLSVGKGWFTGIDGLHVPYNDPLLPIMQFTNMVDGRENPIYDGDIIKWFGPFEAELMQVYWRNGGWHFKRFQSDNVDWDKVDTTEIEVVGNIYQNPDLVTQ